MDRLVGLVALGHLDREEQRGLALRDPLEQLVVAGVPLGQRRQLVAELQQQLQPL